MNDSSLLQESNLAARQPQGATSVIQAIAGEGLAQGPYVAARGGVKPATFHTEGTDNHHYTNPRPMRMMLKLQDTITHFGLSYGRIMNQLFKEFKRLLQTNSNLFHKWSIKQETYPPLTQQQKWSLQLIKCLQNLYSS